MNKDEKRREKIEREIENIINNALTCGREINYTQASAIRRRSIKLRQESKSHPIIDLKQKQKEIELCWKLKEDGQIK